MTTPHRTRRVAMATLGVILLTFTAAPRMTGAQFAAAGAPAQVQPPPSATSDIDSSSVPKRYTICPVLGSDHVWIHSGRFDGLNDSGAWAALGHGRHFKTEKHLFVFAEPRFGVRDALPAGLSCDYVIFIEVLAATSSRSSEWVGGGATRDLPLLFSLKTASAGDVLLKCSATVHEHQPGVFLARDVGTAAARGMDYVLRVASRKAIVLPQIDLSDSSWQRWEFEPQVSCPR